MPGKEQTKCQLLTERNIELEAQNAMLLEEVVACRHAREALQNEKNKLDSVIGAMTSVLTIRDREYTLTYISPQGTTLFGDHAGKKCYRVFEGQDSVCDGCPVELSFKDGKSHTAVRKVTMPDGGVAYWENCANPIRDSHGNIVSCLEISTNVTERKKTEEELEKHRKMLAKLVEERTSELRAANEQLLRDISERERMEESLKESEERFRKIFEEGPMGMVIVGLDFHFIKANEAFCKMVGYTEEELTSLTFKDITHQEHIAQDEEYVKKILAGEIPQYRTEKRYVRKDKEIVWGSLTITARRDENGRLLYFLSIVEDITKRKLAESSHQESENKFRTLVRHLPQKLFVKDTNSVYVSCNDHYALDLGIKPEQIARTNDYDYFPPEMAEKYQRDDLRVVQEGRSYDFEEAYLIKGKEYWVHTQKIPFRDEGGQTVGILGIFEDITERKQHLQQLRKSLGSTIQALAVTVETRDPYTAGHHRRVADLARAIATEMNLSSQQIDGLRMASMIHDIGKICVPAEILSKPTILTELEMCLIRRHVEAGFDILKDIDFPWPVARMVLEHHERMDGSGYPQGSGGEKLLIESRILAVADVIEAIASHRPYRPGRGIDAALDEIAQNNGLLYDTDVVNACQRLFRIKGYVLAN